MKDTPRHKALRERLVNLLRREGIKDERVLRAFLEVPRHIFISDAFSPAIAYDDRPLPIGLGQTISQPYTVAKQTELLEVEPGMKVLEIGTGSGFQSAILCYMGAEVYSVERLKELAEKAKQNLKKVGCDKVTVIVNDGTLGLPQYAPYDRIIVTAAAPQIPQPLIDQLKVNGILVIPVGNKSSQKMLKIIKKDENNYVTQNYGNYVFVPLIGKEGWNK